MHSILSGLTHHHSPRHSPRLTPRSTPRSPAATPSRAGTPVLEGVSPLNASVPVTLELKIESPPIILYGNHNESTGAILSGFFNLVVKATGEYPLESVHIAVCQVLSSKRPTCVSCQKHVTELARWDVLPHAAHLPNGSHGYPFSHLLPGSLPASCTNGLFSVEYYIEAVAVPSDKAVKPFTLRRPLTVSRSIIRTQDRTSIRVFPPTKLSATVVLPPVVFPNSTLGFELRLEGIASELQHSHRTSRWRMRKLNWRVDEVVKMDTAVCDAHRSHRRSSMTDLAHFAALATADASDQHDDAHEGETSASATAVEAERSHGELETQHHHGQSHPQPQPQPQPQSQSQSQSHPTSPNRSPNPTPALTAAVRPALAARGLAPSRSAPHDDQTAKTSTLTDHTTTISSGELKTGWKTDYSSKGTVELVLNDLGPRVLKRVCCNMADPTFGLQVSHILILELVIAEELAAGKSSKPGTPTGAARVLRMQFNLVVTDRSGLGISWDDEVPPVYEDVPFSPPDYDMVAQLPKLEEIGQALRSQNQYLASPAINPL